MSNGMILRLQSLKLSNIEILSFLPVSNYGLNRVHKLDTHKIGPFKNRLHALSICSVSDFCDFIRMLDLEDWFPCK